MNGRIYDPLLARFGTADPMTESPFSTQGWNRYSYVGNSPLNFTDPSGYCFLGCFWQGFFKCIQKIFRAVPILGTILQIAAGAICGPACAILASAFVAGVTSGSLGAALRAGFITAVTFAVFQFGSELMGDFGGAAASPQQGLGGGAPSLCAGVTGGCFVPTDYAPMPPPGGVPSLVPPEVIGTPVNSSLTSSLTGNVSAAAYVALGETWPPYLWPSAFSAAASQLGSLSPSQRGVHMAQASPLQLFARPPPIIGPNGRPLTPLDQLPNSGSVGGPGAGKLFPRLTLSSQPDGVPCVYCKVPTTRTPGPNQLHGDHWNPKSQGGNNSPQN